MNQGRRGRSYVYLPGTNQHEVDGRPAWGDNCSKDEVLSSYVYEISSFKIY